MGNYPAHSSSPEDEDDRRKKQEDKKKPDRPKRLPPTNIGGHKKHHYGTDPALRMPTVVPHSKCRLKFLKLERIKDHLLMEEEFLQNHEMLQPFQDDEDIQDDKDDIEFIRGKPLRAGTLKEMLDDNHAIVETIIGDTYMPVMSFVDRNLLEPGSSVLVDSRIFAVVGLLPDDQDPLLQKMRMIKAPLETYADVGGLDMQIQEVKETVELPLTHPEMYEDMGIKPPKGVIFYGPPGTGKTLLAKAVANHTNATFLRIAGSELVQKHLGDGPKLVRDLFKCAEEHAPSIVFIDEIDAIGTKRIESSSGGEKEIQRTMLELLNQLDGFDKKDDVKVIMATNRIETLDPALIRPGRIDRKIEFPLPDEQCKKVIFNIHTTEMNLADDVNPDEYISAKEELSGADIKAMVVEAGLNALRDRRLQVTHNDFLRSKENLLFKKQEDVPKSMFM